MVLMKRVNALLLVAVLLPMACVRDRKNSGEKDIPAKGMMNVQDLFIQRCATCHGTEGNLSRGGAKKLTESTTDTDEIIRQIRYGKGAMPPFGEMLSEADIRALAEHVKSFRNPH
jgi:mono/diheme cytochrome c family protein